MEKINELEVEKLAKLARLGLTSEENTLLAKQMSEILVFSQKLEEVETGNIVPTSQVTGLTNVFRDDDVIDCQLSRDELLSNTPSVEDGYIKVRTVL
jgi:aspartyl/glutamyl-tRNA(Asn/Gln) amidotransferase C subunit